MPDTTTQRSTFTLDDLFADRAIHDVPVADIHLSDDNPRLRLKDAVPDAFDSLRRSLRKGVFKPLLVEQETGEVVDGHQRLDAAIAEGCTHVPVLYLRKLTRSEKVRLRIELNHPRGHDVIPMLHDQVATLPDDDMKLVMEIPSVATLLAPLDDTDQTRPETEGKYATLKEKMTREDYAFVDRVIKKVMATNGGTRGKTIANVFRDWSLDPNNAEYAP